MKVIENLRRKIRRMKLRRLATLEKEKQKQARVESVMKDLET